jgi:hypothetical protein
MAIVLLSNVSTHLGGGAGGGGDWRVIVTTTAFISKYLLKDVMPNKDVLVNLVGCP